MDWDKLRIFHMVAQAGSFTAAGDSLRLSQSAVSRHISSLEEDLGIILFHRHARGLVLTEQGELLENTCKDVFAKLAMIEGQLQDSRDTTEGDVTITTAEFIGSSWLAPRLGAFHDKYPNIRLNMLLEDRVMNLGMREADAAIRLYKPDQQDLVQKHLTSVHFVVCAHQSYLKKHGTPKTPADLKDHLLIGYPEKTLQPFNNPNWMFEQAGIEKEEGLKTFRINSIFAAYQAVKNGIGIAALPRFMVTQNPGMETLFEKAMTYSVEMYFVYPEERRHSKRIAILRDFIVAEVAKTQF